jgi:ferric-dicitrate binding protein FerR (iron transport regulator)
MLDISLTGIAGLRLLGGTTVDLASVTDDHMHFTFTVGDILMKAGKLGGRMLMVETPTAVASIRGTQFWGQVRKEGQAGTFAVREGAIEITFIKTGEKVLLETGDALDYSADQKRLAKRSAKEAELGAMKQIDEIKID